ncbi:hypothetical protein EG68_01278 [Paragonimus skrjabini miyazakii]|uniref:Uncharacterized protein n=1 Tax=Paragonimus skrjabini miyazakii TaxID=59628 RepID=A0A8S9Z308_9TREM|nr:hypothetical protein EG68_01278 [Paragonimus skrjabini miyazakii]
MVFPNELDVNVAKQLAYALLANQGYIDGGQLICSSRSLNKFQQFTSGEGSYRDLFASDSTFTTLIDLSKLSRGNPLNNSDAFGNIQPMFWITNPNPSQVVHRGSFNRRLVLTPAFSVVNWQNKGENINMD